MLGIQISILGIILLVIPTVIGTLFADRNNAGACLPFAWVGGQMLLWAGFLVISTPLILLEKSFTLVTIAFGVYTGLLLAIAVAVETVRHVGKEQVSGKKVSAKQLCEGQVHGNEMPEGDARMERKSADRYLLWSTFVILLLVQMVLTVCMSYEEGDDAFYVAISTITESADNMYRILPYTGTGTGLDARHGLAPFPVWVAYLARLSGMPAVSVAQVVLPVVLIGMAYAIYYLMAQQLFAEHKKNIPFFMILTEFMVLFGGYSVYSAENFLLVRASQGKAVIANMIIPFLLYLLMLLLGKMQKQEKAGVRYWILLALTMMAGCLCSTLGTLLTCMFLGIVGLCAAVSYHKWKVLLPMALCCAVPAGIALLYFLLE